MSILPKYTLNDKFQNGKKPPEWDFWAWQDSYWHKWEAIPIASIEGLEDRLSKKADLVGGKVPKEQLPFTVETSEIIAIGAITATNNSVSLAVHSSGSNKVRLGGNIKERSFPSNFNYTAVATGVKVLLIYAIEDEFLFHMAEGAEGAEAIEPELPIGALLIRRIIVNVDGPLIDPEVLSGFREKAVDGWKYHFASSSAPAYLILDGSKKANFSVVRLSSAGEINIAGINGKNIGWIYDGLEITISNDTGTDINLLDLPATGQAKKFLLPYLPFVLKDGKSLKCYYSADQNAIVPLMIGGSGDATITFASQSEMENQTPPSTEENKSVSLWGLWKWLQKAIKYIYLQPTTANTVINKIWTDGISVWFTNASGVNKSLAFDEQLIKIITTNLTIDNTYHNSIVRVTGNCNITIPQGLRADFNCVFEAIGNVAGTFVAGSGVTLSAPYGLILRNDQMCTLYKTSAGNFRINGGLMPL